MSKPQEDKNISVPEKVLKDLLTPSEVRMLKNRWQIIQLLEDDLPIREIAQRVGVGTDTVVRVNKMMQEHNLSTRKDKSPHKTSWIFGKSE